MKPSHLVYHEKNICTFGCCWFQFFFPAAKGVLFLVLHCRCYRKLLYFGGTLWKQINIGAVFKLLLLRIFNCAVKKYRFMVSVEEHCRFLTVLNWPLYCYHIFKRRQFKFDPRKMLHYNQTLSFVKFICILVKSVKSTAKGHLIIIFKKTYSFFNPRKISNYFYFIFYTLGRLALVKMCYTRNLIKKKWLIIIIIKLII